MGPFKLTLRSGTLLSLVQTGFLARKCIEEKKTTPAGEYNVADVADAADVVDAAAAELGGYQAIALRRRTKEQNKQIPSPIKSSTAHGVLHKR
ncbi:hypothetical protein PAAG_08290 [Paracoccidioides lutzii Pb01]|uniref:Uncharacterized protein n=1 Tax=Paracoccidioides lutzii (strain ATCC MYA-826 / Pb01) TaxID=502779 RepID=C1HBZ9_PARBA|nr:hypothetical protein PAAG_08290 [Paracoccidioides lutzii Pb01]EEH38563.2 hypothetical protein PAAG_08290 [Paracoccidioides lutzii Pb01]